jgi:hypothetical protein
MDVGLSLGTSQGQKSRRGAQAGSSALGSE